MLVLWMRQDENLPIRYSNCQNSTNTGLYLPSFNRLELAWHVFSNRHQQNIVSNQMERTVLKRLKETNATSSLDLLFMASRLLFAVTRSGRKPEHRNRKSHAAETLHVEFPLKGLKPTLDMSNIYMN